jgi:hypothetical protein
MHLIIPGLGFFGSILYEIIVRFMGSEILRTVLSFIIRQGLTTIGL